MRRLIYIPIVHAIADMGSEADTLKQAYIQRYGEALWNASRRAIDDMWGRIRKGVFSLQLDFSRVRIYQDGLPVSGKEEDIMKEVAEQGSVNYQIVQELVKKGAVLEGTEAPDLLLHEYRHIKTIAAIEDPAARGQANAAYAEEAKHLLKERDAFIGKRIGETLKDGEVGILFMGIMHRVDQHLPPDIQVEYSIHRLPFKSN